jgi:ankyrin repeat protein
MQAGGEALVLKTDIDGSSCLHIACHKGHRDIAKSLIKAGGEALPLMTTDDGYSCLYIACQEGHLEIAKALFKAAGDYLASISHAQEGILRLQRP